MDDRKLSVHGNPGYDSIRHHLRILSSQVRETGFTTDPIKTGYGSYPKTEM